MSRTFGAYGDAITCVGIGKLFGERVSVVV